MRTGCKDTKKSFGIVRYKKWGGGVYCFKRVRGRIKNKYQ